MAFVNLSYARSSTRVGWLKDLDDAFSSFRKPVLAVVRGFAVGWPSSSPDAQQIRLTLILVRWWLRARTHGEVTSAVFVPAGFQAFGWTQRHPFFPGSPAFDLKLMIAHAVRHDFRLSGCSIWLSRNHFGYYSRSRWDAKVRGQYPCSHRGY